MPGDAGLLWYRFGGSDNAVRHEALPAPVLARENENRGTLPVPGVSREGLEWAQLCCPTWVWLRSAFHASELLGPGLGMAALGQLRKQLTSIRSFRSAPESGHSLTRSQSVPYDVLHEMEIPVLFLSDVEKRTASAIRYRGRRDL